MTPAGIKWNHLKVKWGNGDVVTPLPGRALQSAKAKHEDRKQRYCTTFHPCKAQIEQCWADHPDIHLVDEMMDQYEQRSEEDRQGVTAKVVNGVEKTDVRVQPKHPAQ